MPDLIVGLQCTSLLVHCRSEGNCKSRGTRGMNTLYAASAKTRRWLLFRHSFHRQTLVDGRRSHVKNMTLCLVTLIALSVSELYAQDQTDRSPHAVQFVTVDQGVQLEVLDWGGSGRPLIFLAGAGDTAHRFDGFAPQFTAQHHVYGITRRGFGASSKPAPANGNYSADHLGDDVLAVMKALHIDRPVLIGHSIAGEELSSVGSRFPENISGLIYLDAATDFAFYDPAHPIVEVEMNDIRRRIDEIEAGGVDEKKKLLELETAVAEFEKDLHQNNLGVASMPPLPPRSPINAAMNFGMERYTSIAVPALAIYACPHNWDRLPDDGSRRKAALIADDKARCTAWADNFKHGVPGARIVMIPNADHYVYLSNEAQVVAAMNAFLASLH